MPIEYNSPCVVQLTPPGRGAVATLRVEGRGAATVVQTLLRLRSGRQLTEFPVGRLLLGHIGPGAGEEVVARLCTDQAVELHCHGGPAVVAMLQETLAAAGCQPMTWQQWAARSHADPLTAAALEALAEARTFRTAVILLDQYQGAMCRALEEIRSDIRSCQTDRARQQIDLLLARATLGEHLVKPWQVVLAGRVNVGKSSLINALAGFSRAIVHHAPGTTRDAVTVTTAIDGWPVELCDTAGLRESDDAVERAGVALAKERLARADLVVLVFDHSAAWSDEDQKLVDLWPDALLVHNKIDLPPSGGSRPPGLRSSALCATGIEELIAAISRRLVPAPPPPGAAVPFNATALNMLHTLRREICP